MARIAIAGTPAGAENFITALNALGAEGSALLEKADFSQYDGLILPGGADIDPTLYGEKNWGCRTINRELDLQQLEILDGFLKCKKPVLGVCKGHQLLNIYFGGTVCQHIPQYADHQWIDADQSHITHCSRDSFLFQLYDAESFPVNSAHHQAVTVPAPHLHPIQWTEDGIIEAMVHDSLPVIGIQWHPERMCCAHCRKDTVDGLPIFEHFLALCR